MTDIGSRSRALRRANRRLRWTKGGFRLIQIAPKAYRPSARRDVVVRLLQSRQWRLALTVAVMPTGYVLHTEDYHRG